jgi:hypothetical protein
MKDLNELSQWAHFYFEFQTDLIVERKLPRVARDALYKEFVLLHMLILEEYVKNRTESKEFLSDRSQRVLFSSFQDLLRQTNNASEVCENKSANAVVPDDSWSLFQVIQKYLNKLKCEADQETSTLINSIICESLKSCDEAFDVSSPSKDYISFEEARRGSLVQVKILSSLLQNL